MKGMKTAALIGAALMLYSAGAAAQLSNQGMLDQVVTEFATRASSWQSAVMSAATWLFWTLGTISLAWTGGMLILRKADIGDFFAEFIRFIMFFGFFLWLLRNGPMISSAIIRSLQKIGEQASGVSSVTPSGIVDIGFMIWKQAVSNLSLWSPIDSFVGAALSIGIMLLLAAIAVNMLLVMVSAWILMYAGIFFLGFGGSRWTSDMAINYYKTVFDIGVQLMTMVLLVGIGNDLLSTFYAKMSKGTLNFEELGIMLVFCFALLILVNKIPSLLSGIITGSGIGHSGIGNFGAGAIAGAAMGAAGMAATAAGAAGAAVMGGAQNIAGGMSAIKAAFEKTQAGMDSGSGQMPSFGSAGGGASSGGSDSGSSPFAQAAGFADSSGSSRSAGTTSSSGQSKAEGQQQGGKGATGGGMARAAALTLGAAAELAKGAGSLAKNKTVQLVSDFQERASETVGGQVAATIRGNMQDSPAFDGNSLAAADDEVAAFVGKAQGTEP